MPVPSFQQLRNSVRTAIRDTCGLLWDDSALDGIINEAQREYSILSGSITDSIHVFGTENGVFLLPDDFLEPVRFIGSDKLEKPFYSWRYLDQLYPDFRNITGSGARGIIFDFDNWGNARIFPRIPDKLFAGTLFYKRLAATNKIETRNLEAVEQHCLYQVFSLTGKEGASRYYAQFLDSVNEEGNLYRSLSAGSRIRKGCFFR